MRAKRYVLGAVPILALPLLGGCQSWGFLLCFLGGLSIPGDLESNVDKSCTTWAYSISPSASEGEEDEALETEGTGPGGYYESGPNVWQPGGLTAAIDVAIDPASAQVAFDTRQYLRVEDDAEPQHFFQVEVNPDGAQGFQVYTRSEAGLSSGPVAMPATDVVTMRIVRDGSGYHLSAQADLTPPVALIDAPDPAPAARVRVRFGADHLADGVRVQFHALALEATTFGDATFEPIFTRLGAALDELEAAATVAAEPAPDFSVAETQIDDAAGLLAEALELVKDGKQDGTIGKTNYPKLARNALKKAIHRAKQGKALAASLADGGAGDQEKLAKRIAGARSLATLAIANLLGAKTKNAKEVSAHVQTG